MAIEGVGPVTRVEAVSLSAAAGLSSRQSVLGRQRRLRWLSSLREAMGEGAPDDEAENADERILAETRERIAAALDTIEELRSVSDGVSAMPAGRASTASITAAELASWIGAAAERTLRAQARLSPASVLTLVGESSRSAVNGV